MGIFREVFGEVFGKLWGRKREVLGQIPDKKKEARFLGFLLLPGAIYFVMVSQLSPAYSFASWYSIV